MLNNKTQHNMSKVLVMVSGFDRPGITSRLMDIVAQSNCSILDIGQSVTHGFLSLNFILQSSKNINLIIQKLQDASLPHKLNLDFKEVPESFTCQPTQGEKYILACVAGHPITVSYMQEISHTLAQNNVNILRIDNITPGTFSSLKIDTSLEPGVSPKKLKKELLKISNTHSVDAAFIKDSVYRHNKRLVAFDMDSTLIQNEVINDLAERVGKKDEVKEITEKTMKGELNFDESLRMRTAILRGLPERTLQEVSEQLVLAPGCSELLRTLKHLGYKTAVISGSFSFFTEKLKSILELDHHFANTLEIVDGKVSGRLVGHLVNSQKKAELLKVIAKKENISLKQTVAIGDGANDIPMLNTAGLGIAYHAKEIVQRSAPYIVNHGPLTSILYFLGISPLTLEETPP